MSLRGVCLAAAACGGAIAAAPPNPEAYVNTLTGTDSRYDLSYGNILPVVLRPWGFNAWSPVTDDQDGSWFFHNRDARLFGIRCTHQPSPWISDYGSFDLAAAVVNPSHDGSYDSFFSSYDSSQSVWSPYYWNASLPGYGTSAGYATWELTPTRHGAVIRARFPPFASGPTSGGFNQTRRVALSLSGMGLSINASSSDGFPTIAGASTSNSGGVAGFFAHHFLISVAGGDDGTLPVAGAIIASGTDAFGSSSAWIDFDPANAATDTLTIRVATSLISAAQAATNFGAQVANVSFDAVAADAQAEWRALLSATAVTDVGAAYYDAAEQEAMLVTWYSNVYRASQFPRFLWECQDGGVSCGAVDGDGAVHYSPYNGSTVSGTLVADSGFWDAYRTVYPWAAIAHPDVYATFVKGWNNAYVEGGWLPKWSSPGYRGSMVGTLGDVSLADAIVKGIVTGDDAATAYAAIRKDAFELPPDGNAGEGRTCLAAYLADGYIADGAGGAAGRCVEIVSRTLNYMLSDYAIARAAEYLGHSDDAAILDARAANYSLLFEPTTGFMRSRASGEGAFVEPFDEFAWGDPYTEAGPWQYRFEVPYDPQGLYRLYASSGLDMCALLETSQTMASTFHVGAYGSVIHEQTEMFVNGWGQNEHDNQPEHAMMWMLLAADNSTQGACASRAQFWLRQMTSLMYRPGADAFPGDEDNGQMAAWYLLSSLGLYSLAPGSAVYQLGSPLFTEAVVQLPGGKALTVSALGNCAECYYVAGVTWNGAPVTGVTLPYAQLMQGGTLQFNMTSAPPSGVPGGPNPKAHTLKARSVQSRPVGRLLADFLGVQ